MKDNMVLILITIGIMFLLCWMSPSASNMLRDPLLKEARVRSHISTVRSQLRVLDAAIGVYTQEHGAPPSMVPLMKYDNKLHPVGPWEAPGYFQPGPELGPQVGRDPFTRAGYAYWTNGQIWLLFSPGPDGVFNINPATERALRQRDPESELKPLTYDPTNGFNSTGDVFRVGRRTEARP